MNYLTEIAAQVIKFSNDLNKETRRDRWNRSALSFEEIAGFPDVIGCIDGLYINIIPIHIINIC